MDEVNNFIFWRDFLFSNMSSFLLGTKVLEYYSLIEREKERDREKEKERGEYERDKEGFPPPSSTAPPLPSSRSLRFTIVPHTIQCAVEIWLLETISSRHLIDHLFSTDTIVHVFLLFEQRFHYELMRSNLLSC
jgi:hypothetical protein